MSMSVSFSENCEIKETEKQIAKTSHQFQVYNLINYGSQPVCVGNCSVIVKILFEYLNVQYLLKSPWLPGLKLQEHVACLEPVLEKLLSGMSWCSFE